MGGALGIGTPTYNPATAGFFGSPWLGGSPMGAQTPQLLQGLQHLLQLQYAQQQQLQQLVHLVPQQQQLIQHLIQTVAHQHQQQQQPYSMWQQQQQPFAQTQQQPFAPMFQPPGLSGSSGWLGAQSAQPPLFGGQPGYVM